MDRDALAEDEIDLFALIRIFWRHKLLIAAIVFVFGVTAVVLALTATPIYRADVVVAEVHDDNLGDASSLATQLGGLAGLAGLNLGRNATTGEQYQAVLDSNHLAEEFIKRYQLMPVLFEDAPKDAKKPPTLWLAVKNFKGGIVTVTQDTRKGVTIVTMKWKQPAVAARWANDYVALANELIRTRALNDSNRNITYLNGQLEKTNTLELRKVIYNIIEAETKTLMLASGRAEYAFQVDDPAVAPELRISPRRTFMVLVGGALGAFAGATVAFIVDRVRRYRVRSSASF